MRSSMLNTTCFCYISNCQEQARKALHVTNFLRYIFAKTYQNRLMANKVIAKIV